MDMKDFIRQSEMSSETQRVITKQENVVRAVSMIEMNTN